MADEDLLDRLRQIASSEGLSLAEVIREGLQWRAEESRKAPSFIAAGASGRKGHRTAERAGNMRFEPRTWR